MNTIEKFTLGEILGSSNYVVRAARNNLLERDVALKQIPYTTDGEVALVTQEAQKQVRLRHPNIIEVFGADTDTVNKLVLIEMERADAGSLAKLLENGQRLSVERAVQIVCDVLTGLEYAHAQKIIHFDVKPDNILLFKKGTAKLADFGIAKTLSTQGITSKAGGTPGFEGPEYHNGSELFGPRTDLWAVGVVLYIALTGRKPFLSSEQILKCKFEPLTAVLPHDPQVVALQRVLERVFVLYPKRLASAKEFREAIQPPAVVTPPPPSSALDRRALFGIGGVVLLGGGIAIGKLVGGSGSSGVPAMPTPEPTAIPAPTPIPTPRPTPTPKPRIGLTVAEARALPPTYPAPKTLAEYKAQMVSIPGGTFEMGSNSGDSDEKPVHSVTLSAFRMGRTPVTVAMWREFCTATSRKMPDLPSFAVWKGGWGSVLDHPMVMINWNDCKAYADWAGLKLPTEAQFEYAARGGSEKRRAYPWGDAMDDRKAWYTKTSGDKGTAPVSREDNIFVNGYGLVDMSGNVWQCCRDLYSAYGSGAQTDPVGVSKGDKRVNRGGCWNDSDEEKLRCANRDWNTPVFRFISLGVRLCAPLPVL